jgi:hypothetical protein
MEPVAWIYNMSVGYGRFSRISYCVPRQTHLIPVTLNMSDAIRRCSNSLRRLGPTCIKGDEKPNQELAFHQVLFHLL